jgi:hypothetical protein
LSERDSCRLPNSPHIPRTGRSSKRLSTAWPSSSCAHRSFLRRRSRSAIDKSTSLTAATCWTSVVLQGRLHPYIHNIIGSSVSSRPYEGRDMSIGTCAFVQASVHIQCGTGKTAGRRTSPLIQLPRFTTHLTMEATVGRMGPNRAARESTGCTELRADLPGCVGSPQPQGGSSSPKSSNVVNTSNKAQSTTARSSSSPSMTAAQSVLAPRS